MTSRAIPDPGFPDDDGTPDPSVREALRADAAGTAPAGEALAALTGSRLLVPVVALLDEADVDDRGLRREKSSEMAAVLMTGADGRRALLAFTGADSLVAWDPTARPVPVTAQAAARAAAQEDAAAVVVDVAGPASYVVTGRDLAAIAAGWQLARLDGAPTWIGPAPDSGVDSAVDSGPGPGPGPGDSAGSGIIG